MAGIVEDGQQLLNVHHVHNVDEDSEGTLQLNKAIDLIITHLEHPWSERSWHLSLLLFLLLHSAAYSAEDLASL